MALRCRPALKLQPRSHEGRETCVELELKYSEYTTDGYHVRAREEGRRRRGRGSGRGRRRGMGRRRGRRRRGKEKEEDEKK